MDLNRGFKEGVDFKILISNINDEQQKRKQTTIFLISPTTHLFSLVGQSGSHGVSRMITFEIKIWNNAKLYQSIQSCMSVINRGEKREKSKKSEMDADPPWGDGERA